MQWNLSRTIQHTHWHTPHWQTLTIQHTHWQTLTHTEVNVKPYSVHRLKLGTHNIAIGGTLGWSKQQQLTVLTWCREADAGEAVTNLSSVPPSGELSLHISWQSSKGVLEDLVSPTPVIQDKVCYMLICWYGLQSTYFKLHHEWVWHLTVEEGAMSV